MTIVEIKQTDDKYYALLKKIDIGEYNLATNSGDFKAFDQWIFRYGLQLDNNYGIITAFLYNNSLRIQISFLNNIDNARIDTLFRLIDEAMKQVDCKRIDIWCDNTNTTLISQLQVRYPCEPNPYMSHEFHYDYQDYISQDICPLVVMPYEEKYLDDVLQLLEKSFVAIAEAGEFVANKSYYHEKFSNQGKKTCDLFLLKNRVIGMVAQDNGDIEYMAVLPDYQGKGYGAKMLNCALNKMQGLIDRKPFLYCVDSNYSAIRFYRKQGWQLTARAARLQLKLK